MAYQHYRSPFGDTTFTKVFVGGLAWETHPDVMRDYFEQFGEILEAVIITDKNTGKSKGYGFVTFRDAESARRACAEANPVIDGRKANCNIASLGRPRPSPPPGRGQGYHGEGVPQGASPSYSGVPAPLAPPLPPPPAPVIYPPYGYATYPSDYGYHQGMYNPQLQQQQQQQAQYYQQPYGVGVGSSAMGSPYFYGYSMQAARGTLYTGAQRIPPPQSYPYYHHLTHMQHQHDPSSFPSYPAAPPPPLLLQSTRQPFPPPTPEPQTPQHTSMTETEAGAVTSEHGEATSPSNYTMHGEGNKC